MSAGCLSDDQLLNVLTGSIDGEPLDQLALHLDGCKQCRRNLEEKVGTLEDCGVFVNPQADPPGGSDLVFQQFLQLPQGDDAPTLDSHAACSATVNAMPPKRLGPYEILEEIGRGGMGVVFKARQLGLNRLVALKVLLSGRLASLSDLQRFQVEAEAVGRLDHPHIVPVYEAGEQGSFRFLSMRLVEGTTLAVISRAREDRNSSWVRQAATWIIVVARAVHYAHQHGILHRDVKPGNILVDSCGQPHLTDFGLAKMMDGTVSLTGSQSSLGTPEYASPEQLDHHARETTTASDVYSLGAVLYHLLTGQPPFQGNTPVATVRQVLDRRARSPRLLNATVDQDLATICLKCLEKDPACRYPSADALAEDLQRWSEHKPILARPVAPAQQAIRFARRYPVGSTLAILLFLALLIGGGLVLQSNRKMRRALVVAAEARELQEKAQSARGLSLHNGLVAQASALRKSRSIGRRFGSIALLQRADGLRESEQVAMEAAAALANFDLREISRHELPPILAVETLHYGFLTLDAQLQQVVAPYPKEGLVVSHLLTGGSVRKSERGGGDFSPSVTSSPDGRWFVCGRDSRLELWRTEGDTAEVRWPLQDGRMGDLSGRRGPVAFSPDNRLLVTPAAGGGLRFVDLTGMLAERVVTMDIEPDLLFFSPDASHLAVIEDNWVEILEVTSCRRVGFFSSHGEVRWFAWSPSGKQVALASRNHTTVEIRKALTGDQLVTIGLPAPASRMAFHPNGSLLAIGTDDKQVGLWDLSTVRKLIEFEGHPRVLQFSEDGETMAIAGALDQLVCYQIVPSTVYREFMPLPGEHSDSGYAMDLSSDGTLLVSADATSLRFWEVESGCEVLSIAQPSPLGTHLRFIDDDRGLLVNPMDQGVYRRNVTWRGPRAEPLDVESASLVMDHPHCAYWGGLHDQHAVVLDYAGKEVQLWVHGAPESRQVIGYLDDHCATIPNLSPDGRLLVLNHSPGGVVEIWSTRDASLLKALSDSFYTGATFTPDGRYLLTATRRELALWDVSNWERVQVVADGLKRREFECLHFSRDGKLVLVQTSPNSHRLYSYPGFIDPLDLTSPTTLSHHFCRWSDEGDRLYTLGRGNHLYEWKVSVLRQELAGLGLGGVSGRRTPSRQLSRPAREQAGVEDDR